MSIKVNIAVDAMGGENSPKKGNWRDKNFIYNLIKKISFFLYGQQDTFWKKKLTKHKCSSTNHCKIINSDEIILDNESPLAAAKRGKESSMWKAIESQKENKSDISLSAGNTGALLVVSRLILNSIRGN